MNWDPVLNELARVVLLAFVVERALAVVFDMERVEPALKSRDLKPPIAIGVSILLCFGLEVNLISVMAAKTAATAGGPEAIAGGTPLLASSHMIWMGKLLTGLVVAGGSAGAVKLFQDVLGLRRSLRDENKAAEATEREAKSLEARARAEKARAEIVGAQADTLQSTARISASSAPVDPADAALEARIAERKRKIQRGE